MIATDLERIRAYHELTKHRLERYAPGPGYMDWATQPNPFRSFQGTARVELPLPAALDTPFANLRRAADTAPRPLDLTYLAILFELALGLSAWKVYGSTRWALRCNPSSGNLHPTEAYLVCPELPGLPGGVYHYLSHDHALERRAEPADKERWIAALSPGGVCVGISSIYWREAWKYGARAYRYCQHDAGHALATLRYAAAALGWQARLLDGWGDNDIAHLLGLDRDEDFGQAEREAPDALLWIGPTPQTPDPDALRTALNGARWTGTANRLSARHAHHWAAIDEANAAARKPRTTPLTYHTLPFLPPLPLAQAALSAATLFRQRRSAVAFDGRTSISASAFFGMLDALLPRAGVPPWDALPWMPCIHPVLFVHRVDGLQAGLYALPRNSETESALRDAMRPDWLWEQVPDCPPHLPLRLLLPLDTRRLSELISCHQEIAADSAFSLGMLAEFREALEQGTWWYRFLHWEAGMLGHVLYLEAEAAGVRGTGIGCLFDDEMHDLLGLRDDQFQTLYHFTVLSLHRRRAGGGHATFNPPALCPSNRKITGISFGSCWKTLASGNPLFL